MVFRALAARCRGFGSHSLPSAVGALSPCSSQRLVKHGCACSHSTFAVAARAARMAFDTRYPSFRGRDVSSGVRMDKSSALAVNRPATATASSSGGNMAAIAAVDESCSRRRSVDGEASTTPWGYFSGARLRRRTVRRSTSFGRASWHAAEAPDGRSGRACATASTVLDDAAAQRRMPAAEGAIASSPNVSWRSTAAPRCLSQRSHGTAAGNDRLREST